MEDSAPAASEAGLRDYVELARRAFSFGTAASAYAEHRPDYAVSAIEWALEPVAASRASGPVRILDIGAGTGKLTAQLAALEIAGQPASLVAVEPDPQDAG